MSSVLHHPLRRLGAARLALGALVLVAAADVAAAQSLSARSATLDAVLHPSDDRATLELTAIGEPDQTDGLRARTRLGLELGPGGYATSLAVTDDGWWVAGDHLTADRRRVLFVRSGDRDRRVELTAPRSDASIQTQARLLSHDGEIRGLVWMQGSSSRRLSPWASTWNGAAFGEPIQIAPVRRGSQTGLTATALADGRWIAIWSAFDGVDDEIVAQIWNGDAWGEQLALSSNSVPDIMPSVTATETGALVAWSRYDGNDYRLVLARVEQGVKIAETRLGGAGSAYPHLSRREGGGQRLLFLEASSDTWQLLELAPEGRVLRSASAPATSRERPAVRVAADRILFLPAGSDEITAVWNETPRPLAWTFEP